MITISFRSDSHGKSRLDKLLGDITVLDTRTLGYPIPVKLDILHASSCGVFCWLLVAHRNAHLVCRLEPELKDAGVPVSRSIESANARQFYVCILRNEQMAQVFCETAPKLVEHDKGLFLVTHLQVLKVVISWRAVLILQVPSNLPNVVANSEATVKLLRTLYKPREEHCILRKRASHEQLLHLYLVHQNYLYFYQN